MVDRDRRSVLQMIGATVAMGMLSPRWLVSYPAPRWPLWSIRRGDRFFYLTAETPPQPGDWHDARIEALLAKCPVLWTETNHTHKLTQQTLIARYAVDETRPLASWLSSDDERRLDQAASACHLDLTGLAAYRPWFVGSALQSTFYQVSGWKGMSARDVLVAKAAKSGIPLSSEFATQDDVFAWFGSLSPLQEIQFLRYCIDEALAGAQVGAAIYADWAAGNPAPAAAEVARYSRAYPELADKLTFERNRNWLPRFDAMLASKEAPFVVLGLFHMVGSKGILSLCKQQGLAVERI